MSVLVVGTVAFDSIETPFGSAERILGGSASYFALAASWFTPVRIVGVIGQDFPQEYLDLFSQRGIDLAGITRERGDTFHWRGRYHEDINVRDTLELHLNVLSGFVPQLPDHYREADYVFLGNIDPVMQLEVLDPTGAGDSFAGGFLGQLSRSADTSQGGIRRAIVYGSVVASFTVEDFGVKRLTTTTLPDIEERYQRFVQL